MKPISTQRFLHLLLGLALLFGAGLHPALADAQPVRVPANAIRVDTRINLPARPEANDTQNDFSIYLPYVSNFINWQIEVLPVAGRSVSLDLDENGSPHISFTGNVPDEPVLFSLQYANRGGGQWNHEAAANMQFGGGSKLKLNSASQALIAYVACNTITCPLFTAEKATGHWTIQDLVPDINGVSLSLDLDSGGRPHLSFCKQNFSPLQNELWHLYWSGSQWLTETVDLGCWYSTSIRMDSQDHARISYYIEGSGDLKYTRWTGSEWAIETIDTAADVGLWNDLGLDSSDRPLVAYLDKTNRTLKVAQWNDQVWEIQVVDSGLGESESISLGIDSNDRPHIAYAGSQNIRYAFWSDQYWSIWDVDLGESPSLALDANNLPHIVYSFGNLGYLKYARVPISLLISR